MAKKNQFYKGEHILIHKIIDPFAHEIQLKDILQVIIGATILAVPVGFTEETWKLGENLPFLNVFGLFLISILFISIFTYHNYYRNKLKKHWGKFIERILLTYVTAFVVVSIILTLIQRTPWSVDLILALKRVVIVALPASMSAAIADMLK